MLKKKKKKKIFFFNNYMSIGLKVILSQLAKLLDSQGERLKFESGGVKDCRKITLSEDNQHMILIKTNLMI